MWSWWHPISANTGPTKYYDAYEMYMTYLQRDRKLYDKPCGEADCREWHFQKTYNAKWQKQLAAIKASYKGK